MLLNIFIYNSKTGTKKSISCNTAWSGKQLKEHIQDNFSYKVGKMEFAKYEIKDDTMLSELFSKCIPVAIYWTSADNN